MIKITLFPSPRHNNSPKDNPYINDYFESLKKIDNVEMVNLPMDKDNLVCMMNPKYWGDVIIFNWLESIPSYTYGYIQWRTALATLLLFTLKIFKKKIVWMLHNKQPHNVGNDKLVRIMMYLLAHLSAIIITHSQKGVEMINNRYHFASNKIFYLDHPTKNRLSISNISKKDKKYDLLIWGRITKYKGILEFINFLSYKHINDIKTCIVGYCPSSDIRKEINKFTSMNLVFIPKEITFTELKEYIAQSKFVLAPYFVDSILSSGTLMDSLSFGAKIIGPNTGSFADYSKNRLLNVYTFNSFEDIPNIVLKYSNVEISYENYYKFLENNDWTHFSNKFIKIISKL